MTTDQQQPGVGKFNARLEKVSPDGHRATFVMDGSQTFPGVFRREASTNEIAFWLEIESLRVQLADMQRQIEGRVTIAEEIERRREAVGRIRAERDEARAKWERMKSVVEAVRRINPSLYRGAVDDLRRALAAFDAAQEPTIRPE